MLGCVLWQLVCEECVVASSFADVLGAATSWRCSSWEDARGFEVVSIGFVVARGVLADSPATPGPSLPHGPPVGGRGPVDLSGMTFSELSESKSRRADEPSRRLYWIGAEV